MDQTTLSVLKWWRTKRLLYNQALIFTGLMGFVIQAAQQPFNKNAKLISDSLLFEMRAAAMMLILFIILANIAFTAGCVIDLIFNNRNSLTFRERLFLIGYGFAIIVLTFCIIAFLYLI